MILDEDTFQKIGKTFEQANQKDKITCKCDYCGCIFDRAKHNLERSHKHIKNDSCSNIKCVQQKRIDTSRLLFGTDNPFQNKDVKAKIKSKTAPKQKETLEKTKKTCLEIYGTENVFANKEIQERIKQHWRAKHGVENAFQVKEIQEKQKQTIKELYKVHTQEFKDKVINTCLRVHGEYPVGNGFYGKTQKELEEWLNSFGFNFKSDHKLLKNGKQIDMYDPIKKLAIEYCGLHWHHECSKEPRNNKYHYDKYKKCLDQGVQLITIFSDEWEQRQFQCKSHLKSLLGVIERRIYARKCSVKQLDKEEARKFFNDYHIQGANNLGVVFFGLIFDNEVLGVMSLGRHSRQYKDLIVLDRLCFKDGVQVVGGASKLFKSCTGWAKKEEYNSIISFSDNRWSIGRVYEALNFVLDTEYRPDYSYVVTDRADARLSKQSQKKSTVNCPEELTEYEWAKQRGLSRIWDCGKKRWVYKINK